MRLAVVVAIVTAATAAHAETLEQMGGPPSLTPPLSAPAPITPTGTAKDPTTATLLSLGITAGGLGLAALGGSEQIPALSTVGSILFVVGPSTGHAYAGHTWNPGLGARLGGVGLAFLGALLIVPCIEGCDGNQGDAGAVMLIGGGLLYAGGGIYEIATAGEAAHEYNRAHGFEATVVPTGNGIALAGRF